MGLKIAYEIHCFHRLLQIKNEIKIKKKVIFSNNHRSNEFYREMSDFIGTRNGLQCRSHHQKL